MAKVTGLGRGLGSLIPSKTAKEIVREEYQDIAFGQSGSGIQDIPVNIIEPNPYQPRRSFDHDDLDDLISSIKHYGVLQPVIVCRQDNGYELISGERRWRASKIAGLKTIPAIIRDATTQEKLEISLIENIQRKDLNPIEKALAYRRLIDEFNLTQDQAAKKLGKARPIITWTLGFLTLPDKIQKALADGTLSEGHARIIIAMETKEQQMELFRKILANQDFTVRDAEAHSRHVKGRAPGSRTLLEGLLREYQEKMQEALATRVTFRGKKNVGEIVIKYYSPEELEAIVKQIIRG